MELNGLPVGNFSATGTQDGLGILTSFLGTLGAVCPVAR